MEHLITVISIFSTIIFITVLIVTIRIPGEHLDRSSTVLLAASIAVFVINGFSDILEYGGITDELDAPGEYLEIMLDPLFIFFIYSYLSWQERNKTEKARDELEESEDRYRVLSEATFEGIGIAEHGTIIDANHQMAEMLGYDLSELIGMDLKKTIAPDDWEIVKKKREDRHEGSYVHRALKKDGSEIFIEVRGKDVVYKGMTVRQTVMRDITERKKAEDDLRTSNTLLDNIYSSTDFLFAYFDRDFNFIDVNQAYADAGRKPRDYFKGKNHFDLYPNEENKRIFHEVVDTGRPFSVSEKPFEHPGQPERGTTYWDWSLIPVKDKSGTVLNMVFSLNDVTEKVNMSRALRDSEERFRLAFENASIGSCITGTDGRILKANEYFCGMLGYQEQELIGKTFSEFTHSDDDKLSSDQMKSMLAGNSAQSSFEKRYIHKNGSYIWAVVSPSLLRDRDDNPLCFITYVQDITELKMSEEQLKNSEQWFRALFNDAPDAILIADPESGYIQNANPKAAELLGRPVEEIIGLHQSEIHPPEVNDYSKRTFRDHVTEKKDVIPVENTVLRPDGTLVPVEVLGHTFEVSGKRIIMGIFRDITERRRTEKALEQKTRHFQKLLEAFPCFAMILKPSREIVAMNNVARQMGGEVGRQCFASMGKSDKPCRWCRADVMLKKNTFEHIQTWGQGIYWDAYWIPLERDLYLHFAFDITNRKKAEDELIANREKLSAMSMELSMTEERERRNIASDLHDHIAQAMAMTKVKLGEVSRQISGDSLAKLEAIKTEVDRIINNTRSLIFDLSPPVLYELGFKEAVEWIAERIQKDNGIQIIVMAGRQYAHIDQEIRVVLFKAVRELLMNVIKHAEADTVEVIISDLRGNIHIQVKDDGVGFDISKINSDLKENSFGILNLTERIKYIGGTVEFASEPGLGTAIKIMAPMTLEGQE